MSPIGPIHQSSLINSQLSILHCPFSIMKNNIFLLLFLFSLASCMDNVPEPPQDVDAGMTSATSVGEVTTTIEGLKSTYAGYMMKSNLYTLVGGDDEAGQVTGDVVFEGVVVANDVSGNVYQKIVLSELTPAGNIESINVSIKSTNLFSFFPLGQAVRVNLKGLWIGNYSMVPTIGTPYKTSAGNLRLGTMLQQDCKTHLQLVEGPDAATKEKLLTPKVVDEAWLADGANLNIHNSPILVTIEGKFPEADGQRIFTPNVSEADDPDNGYDAGYARNRTLQVGSVKVLARNSTRNEISTSIIPSGKVRCTGLLTYYGKEWQLQMRDLKDLEILEPQP